MNYALLEDEIVARLAPLVTAGHEVEVMPSVMKDDSPVEYKGRITVQVGMAKFDQEDLQSQSATSEQYENTYVELIIRSRRLRTSGGHAGVYELSELCRKLLMGWRSSMSWMPFVCVDFSPINPENIESGVFMYSLRMMTRTIVGPTDEADLSPLIEQITLLPDTQVGPLMPTAELFASAYSVDNAGDQVMLAWISENGYSVTLSGVGAVDAIGSATVTISADTTFTLTVTRGANVATATVEVTVGSNCADATVQLNGTTVGTIPSGDSDSFTVNLDGSPSGSWDGTAWQVTSPPCDDATIELNGVEMTTIPSGDTENILVLQSNDMTQVGSKQGTHFRIDDSAISINGSPVADVKAEDPLDIDVTQGGSPVGSWNGSAWIIPPCSAPSLSIEVYSDAGYTTPASSFNYGATAYIKLVSNGITPTSYTLFFGNGTKNAPQVTQAGDTLAWPVSLTGSVIISATATDGTDATADATPFTLTSTLVIDHALKFDGVNDYAVSGLPKIDLANFSISFVFQLNSTSGRTSLYSFASVNTSGQTAHEMYYGSNAFVFLSRDMYSFAQTIPWTGDTDPHVFTMRYNSTVRAVEIFIDGVSIGVCAQLVTYTNPLWSLVLGRAFILSEYGNVKLTDVRVFNHYLTNGEIATLQTLGNPVGNEVLWYPLTEAIGTTTFATDLLTGYQLAMYNMTAPNGIIAW